MITNLNYRLRPYAASDRSHVFSLLKVLPELYPNGFSWLDRRLVDAAEGKATCTVAVVGSLIAGVTIETPKVRGLVKLSTIWVDKNFRGMGIGSTLLRRCCNNWLKQNVYSAYVTVDSDGVNIMRPVLFRNGFEKTSIVKDRYREQHDEIIFTWKLEQYCDCIGAASKAI